MHSKGFVQISRDFSDGVSLKQDGPVLKREYNSECVLEGGNSFITAACFVSKFVPYHFVTTLTVDGELKYFESISLERRTVMQNFSETISVFPKDKVNKFCSRLLYESNATTKRYITGINLMPAQKCVGTEKEINLEDVGDATRCLEKSAMNGNISGRQLINGEV